ncbi:anti-sigma factor family protein [Cohnella mopanensis]|uniref:anti-sigma factor family protein n=1 Tax=Cohnella mopanensis TaxID=2911966 RepID=UPI001EF989EE|nr:zf-HC2 domain-containing protein [Cohnella mopanensis]
MICQEVMELMQRYIDGDLDQQETSLMMDHAGQCPDCAAMLARLQKLSSELEQLPRVVPKYSLVDAIMPELERLHAAEPAKGTDANEEASEPIRTKGRSNRPARHLFAKISGVVAAGVIVGLMLFSSPDQWRLGGTGSHNEAAAPERAAAPAANESSALMSKQELGAAPMADSNNQEMDIQNQVSEPMTFGATGSDVAPSEDKEKLDSARSLGGSDAKGLENPSANSSDRMSISAYNAPTLTADSPDGKWKAVALEDGGSFQVFRNQDGSEYYKSESKGSKISLLDWNDESTIVYYTLTDASGNATQWQFDTETSKESKR